MNYFTEKEILTTNEHFAFKLRKLYTEDFSGFNQTVDYIPMFIQVNNAKTLDIIFSNNLINTVSRETENLVKFGASYLPKISCPFLLENLKVKSHKFNYLDDYNSMCSYPQKIRMNDQIKLVFSNKLLLDDGQNFVVSNLASDFGTIGKIFADIFSDITSSNTKWQRFQSLTKQEKKVMKLIAKGVINSHIGEQLYISKHTVVTHRKNIYKKLDVNSVTDIVRFSIALELL